MNAGRARKAGKRMDGLGQRRKERRAKGAEGCEGGRKRGRRLWMEQG